MATFRPGTSTSGTREINGLMEAWKFYESAINIMKTMGNTHCQALCYAKLGVMYQSQSQYNKAREYREKALAINIEITGIEKRQTTETLELCSDHSANMTRPENIIRKHSLPQKKLVPEIEEQQATET